MKNFITNFFIILLFTGFTLPYAFAQCTGYMTGGPKVVCPNTSASYWVYGGNVTWGGNIVHVSGNNFASGNTVHWGHQQGTYQITFNSSCGLTYTSVTVSTNFNAGFVQGKEICSGENTTLTVNGFSGTVVGWQRRTPGSTNWVNISGTGGSTLQSQQISTTSTMDYRARIQGTCGNIRFSSHGRVTVNQIQTSFYLSGAGTICQGQSTTLTLTGFEHNASYQLKRDGVNAWYPIYTNAHTYSNPSWPVSIPGHYTVEATKGNCKAMISSGAYVTHIPTHKYDVSISKQICDGQTGIITLSSSQNGVIYELRRTLENNQSVLVGTRQGNGNPLNWNVSVIGEYFIRGKNGNCGFVSMNGKVNLVEANTPKIPEGGHITSCSFNPVIIQPDLHVGVQTFDWYDENGVFITRADEMVIPPPHTPGAFEISAKIVETIGCPVNQMNTWVVTIPEDCEEFMNWTWSKAMDEEGNILAETKSYFDLSGHLLQTQSKSMEAGKIFATMSLKDQYDRLALSTLAAPINGSDFAFQPYFFNNENGLPYSFEDFDLNLNNPKKPDNTVPGTLGWYYSENNTWEDFVPETQYPFSQVEYHTDGSGEVKKSSMAGDHHHLGTTRASFSAKISVRGELSHYLDVRKKLIPSQSDDLNGLQGASLLQFSQDPNGKAGISIIDRNNNLLMTATNGDDLSITNSGSLTEYGEKKALIYSLGESKLYFSKITYSTGGYNLYEEFFGGLIETNWYFQNDEVNLTNGVFRIEEFYNSSVSLNFDHAVSLGNISYNFYDNSGRLIVSIAPEGVKAILENGIENYEADQLPFTTYYLYNHQGRLLSMEETDAGRTEYMYRKDGSIRFSQNADQKEIGTFSYTHYDGIGRPVESGEYQGAINFGSQQLKALLEETYPNTTWSTADAKDWVKTLYDRPEIDQWNALPLGAMQDENNQPVYVQDFLRGAVSFTENEHISTWYSYDEFGRMTWMAQKPKELGMTFVLEYDYNFVGNVLLVGFKSYFTDGQLSDQFYHHYEYDADQRLKVAYTSTTGQTEDAMEQARYSYYLHGPLKRIELGQNLQGVDFVYNIHGWLTSINHPEPDKDPGGDGGANGFSEDAFGMILEYYEQELTNLHQIGSIDHLEDHKGRHLLPGSAKENPVNLATTFDVFKPVIEYNRPAKIIDNTTNFAQYSPHKKDYSEIFAKYAASETPKNPEGILTASADKNVWVAPATYSGQGAVPDAVELAVLKDLYEMLGGDNWNNKTGWPTLDTWPASATSADFATWHGITVSNGDIIRIQLNSNNLSGTIPQSIGNLLSLERLHLFSNPIHGSLPDAIGNLHLLEQLYIYTTQLTGNLPNEIGNLLNLTHLRLENNNLTGQLSTSIGNLVNLRWLYLHGNSLDGNIPETVGNLTLLQRLYLHNNNITGTIPSSVGDISALQQLYLYHNQITGTIPETIGNLSSLQQMYLYGNQLSGPIPSTIGSLTSLTHLRLESNQLTGEIPASIGNLQNLVWLYLFSNDLSGPLPPSLGNLGSLERMYLYNNQLSGNLPSSLAHLDNLIQLYLYNNQFSGSIPESWGNMSNLRHLRMHNNNLEGEIPASLGNLNKLVSIYLNHNNLQGEIPEGLGNIPTITQIYLHYNKLIGPVPESIVNIPNLTHVYLRNNHFTTFPDLSQHPNKANLRIWLQDNHINHGSIEQNLLPNGSHPFHTFSYSTQSSHDQNLVIDVAKGENLEIFAPDGGPSGSYIWEKRNASGTWVNINGDNQNSSDDIFLIEDVTPEAEGFYRYRVSNSLVTNFTLTSGPILVRINDPLPDITHKPGALYNGMITAMAWRTDAPPPSPEADPEEDPLKGMYLFDYDDRYQLKEAVWADPDFASGTYTVAGNKYRVTGLEYDYNGNILNLHRYGENGARLHKFAYEYEEMANKLHKIEGYAEYKYNALGQMIAEVPDEGDEKHLEYDVSGKVVRVFKDEAKTDLKVSFVYDDRGFRLVKKNHETGRETWYIRDGSGTVMAIYERSDPEDPLVIKEIPVYGSGKIGTYYPQPVGVTADNNTQAGSMAYELTDHLGNVRAVMKKRIDVYTATMEDTGEAEYTNPRVQEMAWFENLFETEKKPVSQWLNHTPASLAVPEPKAVAYLNGEGTRKIGPAIALKVRAGDKVDMLVFSKHKDQTQYSSPLLLADLVASLTGTFAYSAGLESVEAATQAFSGAFSALGGYGGDEDDRPRAFLNYLYFDKNFIFIDGGFDRVTADAGFEITEYEVDFDRLALDMVASQDGYVYIYVSNETPGSQVWFDDLTVTHEKTYMARATDYYPFGHVLREAVTEDDEDYRWGYQGQFAEKDEETGWSHFELRQYDPIVGRWLSPDPYRQYFSPYVGMGNDPVNGVDPDGGFSKFGAWWRNGFSMKGVYQSGSEWGFNRSTGKFSWESIIINGEELFVRAEIFEFRVGKFGEGSTEPLLTAWEPNLAGRIKEGINDLPWPVSFVGNAIYETADNAYVSFFQLGGIRYNLEGFGVNNNEVTEAGALTIAAIIPYSKVTRVGGLNTAQFSSLLKGTNTNKLLYSTGATIRGRTNKVYNYFHRRQIDYSIKGSAVAAGAASGN